MNSIIWIRKLICLVIGCRSICLFSYHWGADRGDEGSMSTSFECECCGKQRTEQWDT